MASQPVNDKRRCVIHIDKKLACSQQPKVFDESSWQRIKSADAFRRGHSNTSKYFVIQLPDCYDDTIGYHTACYKNFTAVHRPDKDQVVQTKEHVLRSDLHLQTSSSGLFPPVCLFCGKATKSLGQHKKEHLGNCETDQAGQSIYDAAISLGDDEMLARIAGVDMIAKEVKYHHTCRRAYLNKATTEHLRINLDANNNLTSHQKAFDILKIHIVETLIDLEGAELLTSLHARYLRDLADEHSTYSAASLCDKIIQAFPDQLKQCKLSNKQGIIIYNNTLSEDAANRRAMFDHTIIVEAAFYLRGLIKNVLKQHEDLPENLTTDMLSNGQGDPPEELLTFFKVLYTGSLKAAANDKVIRLIESVCADVMFASSRGRFKPGKHLNMGLGKEHDRLTKSPRHSQSYGTFY